MPCRLMCLLLLSLSFLRKTIMFSFHFFICSYICIVNCLLINKIMHKKMMIATEMPDDDLPPALIGILQSSDMKKIYSMHKKLVKKICFRFIYVVMLEMLLIQACCHLLILLILL